MTANGKTRKGMVVLSAALGAALSLAPLAVFAEEAEEALPVEQGGDVTYEVSDPADSPPVNYRSDYDADYDTPALHDAEMYAEEYEKQREEERIRNKEQLDRINDFSSGAVTTDGVMGGSR